MYSLRNRKMHSQCIILKKVNFFCQNSLRKSQTFEDYSILRHNAWTVNFVYGDSTLGGGTARGLFSTVVLIFNQGRNILTILTVSNSSKVWYTLSRFVENTWHLIKNCIEFQYLIPHQLCYSLVLSN